jgi:SAM-dependent methyltransferase
MFKNLFGSKKESTEIKITEEEAQIFQDFEQASLVDFKILENEEDEAIEEPKEEVINELPNLDDFSEDYLLNAPEIAGWMSTNEQELLFSALLLFYSPSYSVLDVGCGRADLYGYLRRFFPEQDDINYTGIDFNANMISVAERKYPVLLNKLSGNDILTATTLDLHDWVFGSGLFNLNDHPDMFEYGKTVIDKMYENATIGVAFNLLTGLPEDLNQSDIDQLVVHNTADWLNYLVSKYTKVVCRTDYMVGDVTFFIFK